MEKAIFESLEFLFNREYFLQKYVCGYRIRGISLGGGGRTRINRQTNKNYFLYKVTFAIFVVIIIITWNKQFILPAYGVNKIIITFIQKSCGQIEMWLLT